MYAIRNTLAQCAFESSARTYGRTTDFASPNVSREQTMEFEYVLAALYLAGAPRGLEISHRNWPEVLKALRGDCLCLRDAVKGLRRRGLRDEALALETPGLLDWVERRVRAGVVLTAASQAYPSGWIRKLGGSAPAALWKRGELPSGPFLAVVGSRRVGFEERLFAREIGAEAVRLGYAVVSGAAAGCDRAAARGTAEMWLKRSRTYDERRATYDDGAEMPLVEILPCGMSSRRERFSGCVLSPFACKEEFSGPNAMRRNALIYSVADAAVVVHAHFGEGGTWRGAVEANRRRLCRLIVRDDRKDQAARALVGLGALGLSCASDLARVLVSVGAQSELALEG